jgi:hypothetical protein
MGSYLLLLVFLAGCSSSSILSKRSDYKEDLSKVRPEFTYQEPVFEVPVVSEVKKEPIKKDQPTITPTATAQQLNRYLNQLAEKNKSIRYISGFRIQLYVGNVRSEADAAKAFIYQFYKDITPYVTYTQPTYRVKAGDFIYRDDAEKYLESIRSTYQSALILPEKIEIRQAMELGENKEY